MGNIVPVQGKADLALLRSVPTYTSLHLSEEIGVRHDNLLKLISRYAKNGDINTVQEDLVDALHLEGVEQLDSIRTTYLDEHGQRRPMYLLTRTGVAVIIALANTKQARESRRRLLTALQQAETAAIAETERKRLKPPRTHAWAVIRDVKSGEVHRCLVEKKALTQDQLLLVKRMTSADQSRRNLKNTAAWERKYTPDCRLQEWLPTMKLTFPEDGSAPHIDPSAFKKALGVAPKFPAAAFRAMSEYKEFKSTKKGKKS
jgi:phage regulator Rha-like protein